MDQQKEEALYRFRTLLPSVARDPRFILNFGISNGESLPVVYLAEDETEDDTMPYKYIMVLKKAENLFALKFIGFFAICGSVPVPWWPRNVSGEELDGLILKIFDDWIKLQKSYSNEAKKFFGPTIDSLPL